MFEKMSPVVSKRIRDDFPAFYRFLPEAFDQDAVVEKKATCENCAMCDKSDYRPGDRSFFNPATKCCTYHPNLPAYQVGAILSDKSSAMKEGKQRIEMKIESGVGVTPRGIDAPQNYKHLYENADESFGRSRELLCPYFDERTRGCSIWQYRNGVCTTYFCKQSFGGDGSNYWWELRQFMQYLEDCLVDWVIYELGINWRSNPNKPWGKLETISIEDLSGTAPAEPVNCAMWGAWAGREEAYFKETYRQVAELNEAGLRQIGGIQLDHHLRNVQAAYEQIVNPIQPEKSMRNPQACVMKQGDKYQVVTYSPTDPLLLSKAVIGAIDYFDGENTVVETREIIAREQEVSLSDDLLVLLWRHQILIPV